MIFQNCPKYHEPRRGEWYLEYVEILWAGITAKYYMQVMLLFVYNRSREISVTHKRPFFLRLKKTNTGVYVRKNLFTSRKKWLTVFCETSTNHSRQTTWNNSMKVIYKSRLFRSLQRWYNKATLLYHRVLLLYHYYVEIVML